MVAKGGVGWMFGVLRKNRNEYDSVGNLKILKNFHKPSRVWWHNFILV
jgi:hypothetical protein